MQLASMDVLASTLVAQNPINNIVAELKRKFIPCGLYKNTVSIESPNKI